MAASGGGASSVTMGQGEYIFYFEQDGEKSAPSEEIFGKIYEVVTKWKEDEQDAVFSPEDRYETLKERIAAVDPKLSCQFVPETLYHIFAMRSPLFKLEFIYERGDYTKRFNQSYITYASWRVNEFAISHLTEDFTAKALELYPESISYKRPLDLLPTSIDIPRDERRESLIRACITHETSDVAISNRLFYRVGNPKKDSTVSKEKGKKAHRISFGNSLFGGVYGDSSPKFGASVFWLEGAEVYAVALPRQSWKKDIFSGAKEPISDLSGRGELFHGNWKINKDTPLRAIEPDPGYITSSPYFAEVLCEASAEEREDAWQKLLATRIPIYEEEKTVCTIS